MAQKLPERDEIEKKYKWRIEDLYETDAKWEEDYEKLSKAIEQLGKFQAQMGKSSESLLEALTFSDEISMLAENVYVYANQRLHENTGNAVYQNMAGKAQILLSELSRASAYMTPELLNIPEEKLNEFMKSNEKLKVYEHYLQNVLREKPHVLGEKEEALLAGASEATDAPSNIFTMFNNADLKFPVIKDEQGEELEITHGRYSALMQSKDRRVRKDTFEGVYHTYDKWKNTLAATFEGNVKQEIFFARVRNYSSSLEMGLSGSHIPVSVYENLIGAVHDYLPSMYRYMELRKKVLGLDELHMYDIYVPMIEKEELKIPFSEARQMVEQGMKPLGEDYVNLLRKGFDGGWIDLYENQGKKSGAYSWGAYGTHPYVLLNYQENLNNVFTVAHEMGHALHSYYSDEKQPYIYAGYKIFVAEVASTCNEALLIHYLLENTTEKKEKAYLINYFLEQFRTTLFRQTMFAEFEKIVHEMAEAGEPLTADALSGKYYELNQKYYGDSVVSDKEIAMEWARIPHFYTPFYVYQYATGFSAAVALSAKILKEGKPAADAYKQFLSGGSSKDPIDLLKGAGVDMSSKEPVKEALKVFDEYITMLEKLL